FDVDGKALENRVENTAGFTGRHHVGVQIVPDSGIQLHRGSQVISLFDFLLNAVYRGGKLFVLLGIGDNLQTLHQRNAGVDHDGELAGEHRDVFRGRITTELEVP